MLNLDPYQEKGADWLANGPPVLYLADQMRVGKTPQCVVACARTRAKLVVVICPGIVRGGWLSEFRNFCPDRAYAAYAVVVYSAKDIERVNGDTRLILISYDLARTPAVFAALYAVCAVFGLDVLILDEAHSLTNREAKRVKAILGLKCTGEDALAGLAKRVWFVSGTPMRRDASDLFPFCRMAGLWKPSRTDFTNRYCFGYHDGYEYKITGSKNLPHLKKLLAPVTLRRLRTDIAPDLKLNIGYQAIEAREVSPTHPVLKILQAQEPAFAEKLSDALKQGDLSTIDIPHMSTIRRVIGLAKVAGMIELIENDLDEEPSRKIAVFGIHRDPLRYLRNGLTRHKACLMFGGSSPEAKDRMLAAFGANHKNKVFIGNLASAGMGIDLSAADLIYIFEPSWIPVDNAQALCRIINMRQFDRTKEAVFVGLAGSIDDQVSRICERRSRDIEALYSAV